MTDQNLPENFNAAAQKIISYDEFGKTIKKLYKSELSFGEKVLLHLVEEPVAAMGAVAGLLRGVFSSAQAQARRKLTGDASEGLYEDTNTGKVYINTAIVPFEESRDWARYVTPKLTQKISGLSAKAIAECKDYTHLRNEGRLKPL